MAEILAEIRFCRTVSCFRIHADGRNVLTSLTRVLFMGGTSCIVVGFSFATDNGCKRILQLIYLETYSAFTPRDLPLNIVLDIIWPNNLDLRWNL
jgi:hypothetical protein